jgi:trehalose-phosphatase
MRQLNDHIDIEDFFSRLRAATRGVLCLDYDGTLAPFHEQRHEAVPYSGVRERLTELVVSEHTRLVIVSGRWTEDLKPLLGMEHLPEIWGCHGAERMTPDGRVTLAEMPFDVAEALDEVQLWAEQNDLKKYVERKPVSVAFHWRGLSPDRILTIQRAVSERFNADSESPLALHEFDGGLELKAEGINKGHAVSEVLAETEPRIPIAYLGDDFTDEDAFRTLGDRGLSVLVREELRPTAADYWIHPPDELLDFLDRWLYATR